MAFGGKQFHMPCDHELADEKTRCSGKNASYITKCIVYVTADNEIIICDIVDVAIFAFVRFFPLCKKIVCYIGAVCCHILVAESDKNQLEFFIYFPFIVYPIL